MTMPRLLWLGVFACGLAGCIPFPRHYRTAPQISGVVMQAGHPVVGMHVQLADVMTAAGDAASTAQQLDTVTDAQGRFGIGPIRRFSWRTPVPLFSVDTHTVPWGLRLSSDGQRWQPGWLTDPTLYGELPRTPMIAHCDPGTASKSSVVDGDLALVGNGVCTLTLKAK